MNTDQLLPKVSYAKSVDQDEWALRYQMIAMIYTGYYMQVPWMWAAVQREDRGYPEMLMVLAYLHCAYWAGETIGALVVMLMEGRIKQTKKLMLITQVASLFTTVLFIYGAYGKQRGVNQIQISNLYPSSLQGDCMA